MRNTQKPGHVLVDVAAYKNAEVILRIMEATGDTQEQAEERFEAAKQYLARCAVSNTPLRPTKYEDEAWHQFILFTADYERFCLTHFGYFIHHNPTPRLGKVDVANCCGSLCDGEKSAIRGTSSASCGSCDDKAVVHGSAVAKLAKCGSGCNDDARAAISATAKCGSGEKAASRAGHNLVAASCCADGCTSGEARAAISATAKCGSDCDNG